MELITVSGWIDMEKTILILQVFIQSFEKVSIYACLFV